MSYRELAGWLAVLALGALLGLTAFSEALNSRRWWDDNRMVWEYCALHPKPPMTFAQWQARGYR